MSISKLNVRLYGDPCLRKISAPVKAVGPSERLLIKSMIETLYDQKGIGLAAPQVGINERILVVDIGEGPLAIINPEILSSSGAAVLEEGCLSIPGITIEVERPEQISIRYTDENNKVIEKDFDELMARVIQHEVDHLDGKMIVDYLTEDEQKELEPALKKIGEKEDES